MLCAAWPHVRGDLTSTRQAAAVFLDNPEGFYGILDKRSWVTRWTTIGDAHGVVGDAIAREGAFDEAAQAWLCALTAFEVAGRLAVGEDGSRNGSVLAKVEAGIQSFESLDQKIERVHISCCDQPEYVSYYVAGGHPDRRSPAVICISREEEPAARLLGRLLPVVIGRNMSVLVVSHEEISNHSSCKPEMLLSCCLDYVSTRPEVDSARIGIYGEGLSAALATDLVTSDRRVAAAVCDGGLWNWARTVASIRWITSTADMAEEDLLSAHRSRLLRQLRCPVLVVAGGRGTVSASEAINLQEECIAARMDLELLVSPVAHDAEGEIENFVTSDVSIFGWLERKLAHSSTF